MIHLLMSHPGTHAVAHAAPVAALPLIFRPLLRLVGRKPAVPEVQTTASGTGAGGSDWDDAMPRPYDERLCALPESHGKADPYYCTVPAHHCWAPLANLLEQRAADDAWHGKTEPRGYPVLGDKMLSQVRAEQDAEPAAPAPWRPSSVMSTGEFRALDVKVDYWRAQPRRPVNGRSLGDQPRRHPELDRQFTNRPGTDVLRRVITGLKNLDKPEREATYRGGWQ